MFYCFLKRAKNKKILRPVFVASFILDESKPNKNNAPLKSTQQTKPMTQKARYEQSTLNINLQETKQAANKTHRNQKAKQDKHTPPKHALTYTMFKERQT